MSVCRFGDDSDVYVFFDAQGGITCCRCGLSKDQDFNAPDQDSMEAHLRAHIAAGDKVPLRAFVELRDPS